MKISTWMWILSTFFFLRAFHVEASWVNISIKYIESPIYENSIMAKDLAIHQSSASHSFMANSLGECRKTCWSVANCSSYSSEPNQGRVMCRLSNKGPVLINLEAIAGAVYIFKLDSIPNVLYRMEDDGFMYVIPINTRIWEMAKLFCDKIPGHRLGMYQTEAQCYTVLKLHNEIGKEILMDMLSTDAGPRWGDGKYFEETSAAGIVDANVQLPFGNPFRTYYGQYDDTSLMYEKAFACQANPLGLNW